MDRDQIALAIRMILRNRHIVNRCDKTDDVKKAEAQDRKRDIQLFRIVHIDSRANMVYLCNLADDEWPFPAEKSLIEEQINLEDGSYIVVFDDPWSILHMPSARSINASARLEMRYELIKPLIEHRNLPLILDPRQRSKIIILRAEEVNSTRQTLSQILKQWFKRGMTLNAILADYANCGTPKAGKGKRKIKEKLGAPRTISPGKGTNITNENRPALIAAAQLWMADKARSYNDAIEDIAPLYLAETVIDENNVIVEYKTNPDRLITVAQLRYYIHTTYPEHIIRRCKYGERNYNKNGRELVGTADQDVQGPGDTFIIDSTVADAYLVSELDRNRIVGRPILYLIIDLYSRMIVGLHITFEGPSWPGAVLTLLNTVTPKIEYCKRYGLQITENQWPAHHLSKIVTMDKAPEFISTERGKFITKTLHMEIQNTPAYRADWKAPIERQFGIIQPMYRDYVPGYVKKDFNERGAKDYRQAAVMTLSQFTKQVICCIMMHNATPITKLDIPAPMITEDLQASPRDLWEWGVIHKSGSLKTFHVDEVALGLLERKEANVTEKGLQLHPNVYYSCPTAEREGWFADARKQGWKVEMSYDINRCNHAYIHNPRKDATYELCTLKERSLKYERTSQFELDELDLERKISLAKSANSRLEERLFWKNKMDETMKESMQQTAAELDPEMSQAARVKDMRQNRAIEAEYERKKGFPLLPAHSEPQENNESKKISERKTLKQERMIKAIALLRGDNCEKEGAENEKANPDDGSSVC